LSGIIDSIETATGIDLDGNRSLGPTSTRAEQRAAAAAAAAAKRERLAEANARSARLRYASVKDKVGLSCSIIGLFCLYIASLLTLDTHTLT